jgi:hypothetical protein
LADVSRINVRLVLETRSMGRVSQSLLMTQLRHSRSPASLLTKVFVRIVKERRTALDPREVILL